MIIKIKGLIGSGKTTCAEYISTNYSFVHYNCDQRVKYLYANDQKLIAEITEKIIGERKSQIDIEQLKKVVFANNNKLQELEQIIHPAIKAEIEQLMKSNNILLDCQQIDKLGLKVDYSLNIQTQTAQIEQRVINRDGRSTEEIARILKIQESTNVVDSSEYIIKNDETVEIFKQRIDEMMEVIGCEKNR